MDKKAYQKAYREANKEKIKAYHKTYIEERTVQGNIVSRHANKCKIADTKIAKRKKLFYARVKRNKILREIRHSLPMNKAKIILRVELCKILRHRGLEKYNGLIQSVGCTGEFLVSYIESRFMPGMDWSNRELWHIDHLVPLALAVSIPELYALSNYRNLAPVWFLDNAKKGRKLLPEYLLLADQLLNNWQD